jgi:hypothetical protein
MKKLTEQEYKDLVRPFRQAREALKAKASGGGFELTEQEFQDILKPLIEAGRYDEYSEHTKLEELVSGIPGIHWGHKGSEDVDGRATDLNTELTHVIFPELANVQPELSCWYCGEKAVTLMDDNEGLSMVVCNDKSCIEETNEIFELSGEMCVGLCVEENGVPLQERSSL